MRIAVWSCWHMTTSGHLNGQIISQNYHTNHDFWEHIILFYKSLRLLEQWSTQGISWYSIVIKSLPNFKWKHSLWLDVKNILLVLFKGSWEDQSNLCGSKLLCWLSTKTSNCLSFYFWSPLSLRFSSKQDFTSYFSFTPQHHHVRLWSLDGSLIKYHSAHCISLDAIHLIWMHNSLAWTLLQINVISIGNLSTFPAFCPLGNYLDLTLQLWEGSHSEINMGCECTPT